VSRRGRWTSAILRAPYPIRLAAANLYGWRLARRRFAGSYRRIFEALEASQWRSPQALRADQETRLRSLIGHAYTQVPYYQQVMRERDLRPRDLETVEDLKKLPLLTKEILNDRFDDLRARDAASRRSELHRTSGTTGVQLRGFLLPFDLRWPQNHADLYRAYRWAGFERGMRRATVAGRWFTLRAPYTLLNHAEHQLLVSAHHLDDGTLPSIVRALDAHRPEAVQGHPSALTTIARHLVDRGQTLPARCVLTTGEQLFEDQRRLLETAFACEVFDGWGQGEAVGRAYECDRHDGYHFSSEFAIAEIEPFGDGPEGVGEIVATSLHNDVMPFIRYRTGDLAAWADGPCSCGRGLLLLRDLSGRIDDAIEDPAGRRILPVSIRTRLASVDGLESYQLIQRLDGYEFRVVLEPEAPSGTVDNAGEALAELFGDEARIEIRAVEEIPRTSGGKTRLVHDARGEREGRGP